MRPHTPLLALALSACLLPVSLSAADQLLQEPFDEEISPERWKVKGTVENIDGHLVMDASSDRAPNGVHTLLEQTAPMPALNFMKKPLTIKLTNLALDGSADPEARILLLTIATGPDGEAAPAYVKLRISGDGTTLVTVGNPTVEEKRDEVRVITANVTLPLKEMVLLLDEDKARIEWESEAGVFNREAQWEERLDREAWATAEPMLRLKNWRRGSSGESIVKLDALEILSGY